MQAGNRNRFGSGHCRECVCSPSPHPVLLPVVLGPHPTSLACSSAKLPWRGLLLERHVCSPGERPAEASLDRPVLVMLCSPVWRGERKAADGRFAPATKTLGTLTVVPKGPVAPIRSEQVAMWSTARSRNPSSRPCDTARVPGRIAASEDRHPTSLATVGERRAGALEAGGGGVRPT